LNESYISNLYPTNQPDRLNNVEKVVLWNSQPGIYTVTVVGYQIPMGPQDFALVVSYATSDIQRPSCCSEGKGLSALAISLIVIVSVAAVGLLVILCYYLRNRGKETDDNTYKEFSGTT